MIATQLALALSSFTASRVYAQRAPAPATTAAATSLPSAAEAAVTLAPPAINAAAFVVVEATSGQVIADVEAKRRRDPASLTKLMTAYIVFDALYQKKISLSQRLRIPERAWKADGARLNLPPGTPATAEDLVRGMLIHSANDAAVALAISVAGNEGEFIASMNREAKRLGMNDTNFLNPTGLSQQGHYSTAYDLTVLALAIMREYPQYARFFAEKSFTLGNNTYENRNRLLFADETVDGMKTGFTDAAGYCLIATVKRGPRRLLAVMLGAPSEAARIAEMQKLIDWSFTAYEPRRFYEGGKAIQQLDVWKSTVNTIPIGFRDDVVAINAAGKTHEITTELTITEPAFGPIQSGDKVGVLKVKRAGNLIYERDVVAFEAAPQAPIWKRMWHVVVLFFKSLFK